MSTDFKLSCVLFDLDGTLVDTAPDLIANLNDALVYHGFSEIVDHSVKPFISFGAAGMVNYVLKQSVSEEVKAAVVDTMLAYYQANIIEHSLVFAGILDALAHIESKGLKWGVVTNKRERFTTPLMAALNLTDRAACIISGDTTGNSKPHIEPMLMACKIAEVLPHECVYVGDAPHDITAGKNAQMKTIAALYGYINSDNPPETWGADVMIKSPEQLTDWINSVLCL